jgi:Bax protein
VRAVTIAPQAVRTLQTVYDRHSYDLTAIAADQAAVPPIFVSTLPEDWRSIERAETRKRMFVKTVLPLVLKANAAIRTDRRRLLELAAQADGDPANLGDGARYWLNQLAARYQVDGIDFAKLKQRVDVIPPSLAIAQAANESGWGTSRFARQGNALFGQWTWDTSEGITPKELQKGKGNYAVRKFSTLGESVAGYMKNLNTHGAYAPMRERRAQLRRADKPLSGAVLAGGLVKYSQRGQAYVEEIRGMISYNDFQRYDDSRLSSGTLG